jgi:hypothetical protein
MFWAVGQPHRRKRPSRTNKDLIERKLCEDVRNQTIDDLRVVSSETGTLLRSIKT